MGGVSGFNNFKGINKVIEKGNGRGLERSYGVGNGMFTRVGIGGNGNGLEKELEKDWNVMKHVGELME